MKIVFYNTQSIKFNPNPSSSYYYPARKDMFEEALAPYTDENEFILVSRRPGTFLLDMEKGQLAQKAEGLEYILVDEFDDADKVAQIIIDQKPDLAVAISTPDHPYDWSYLKESIIAEKLEEAGIKTIAAPVISSIGLFDKWRSQLLFRAFAASNIPGVYIDKNIYNAEQTNPILSLNDYKEYVQHRIKSLNFPVIIKNTVGAGSVGVSTANDFEEAIAIIDSSDDDNDLIVEELVDGEQFGTEIHQTKDGYDVLPPYRNSTNDEGIMDPRLNVKFGPVTDEKYNIPQLQEELKRIAETLQLSGISNLDLIFKDGKWYIIEINPRWSGMTSIITASEGRSPIQIFTDMIFDKETDYSNPDNLTYAVNFKNYNFDIDEIHCLEEREHVKTMFLSGNKKEPFTEIVLGGFEKPEDILVEMEEINKNYNNIVTDELIEEVRKLIEM